MNSKQAAMSDGCVEHVLQADTDPSAVVPCWSLKANQLFTDMISKDLRSVGFEEKCPQITFLSDKEACITIGASEFLLKLSEVEHSVSKHPTTNLPSHQSDLTS